MNETGTNPGEYPPRGEPLRVLTEWLVVVLTGLVFALVANQLSPRGLSLNRDYFPGSAPVVSETAGVSGPGSTTNAANPAPVTAAAAVRTRLEARGLRLIDSEEARALYEDPRRVQELVIFVDARNDQHYQEGHIPGAYAFDHYYPDQHLPTLLPVCQQAEQIIVYCTGGECEDSEFAAILLKEVGIPTERLGIYAGGIIDWRANGMPIEVGPRGSGQIEEPAP